MAARFLGVAALLLAAGSAGAAAAAGGRKEAFRMIDGKASLAGGTADYVSEAMSKLSDGGQLAVVASLGPRHIGKSALLNQAFGAKFDDGAGAGVWISPAAHNKDVLLLNAVAADSADSELTQKRLATLCSSVADCVIVNAWHTTAGRPTSATVDILSALFAEQLRQASEGAGAQRSLVLYALHGAEGEALSAPQRAELEAQVATLWEAAPKPAGLAGAALSDFFDVQYVGVPAPRAAAAHKEAMASLRARFKPAAADGGAPAASPPLLKRAYTKAIDVENFGVLAEQLWADACAEADDGLAATREQMRTCYLASQAFFGASAAADKTLARWSAQVARKRPVAAFGAQGRQLLSSTLAAYDASTAGCEPGAKFVGAQRARLAGHVRADLARLFNDQVRAGGHRSGLRLGSGVRGARLTLSPAPLRPCAGADAERGGDEQAARAAAAHGGAAGLGAGLAGAEYADEHRALVHAEARRARHPRARAQPRTPRLPFFSFFWFFHTTPLA